MLHSKKHINFALAEDPSDENTHSIEKIVTSIKSYSQHHGNLLQKYSEDFFLSYFDSNLIQQTLTKLTAHSLHQTELKLEQFLRYFIGFIEHKEDETLFLAMSLRNLFLKIKDQTNNETGVKFTDFTNFLCDRITKGNPDQVLPLKQVPEQNIDPDIQKIRQIDLNPPLIFKDSDTGFPRVAKEKKKKDKKLIERKPVSQFIYNHSTKQIITMGRLSSCIHFYDLELRKLPIQINPKTYIDASRQIAILSMDFDEQSQRIGVIINGIGIAFWEGTDNFETQKTIPKYQGDKIFYLRLFKEWVTADKNSLYFWDLKEESIRRKINLQQASLINDLCAISHLRCICLSYTTEEDKKLIAVFKNYKPIARYELGSSGCHSLYYNAASQMVISAGFHKQLEVLEVENGTYSINLRKQLKGHSSIVTCVSDIRNTNFILSGDDSGQVRIWQLNFMKCIQVVRVSKYINEIYCTGQKLIFSDSRLNTMEMDKFCLPYMNDEEIIHHFYEEQAEAQFLISRKSIRKINFNKGITELIFLVCQEEEEISSVTQTSSGILLGTSRGHLKLYTMEGRLKWEIPAHEGQISQVKYDRKTRFIFSLGADNKLTIWPQKSILQDGVKKVITFKNKNFNLLTLFNEVRLLFLGSTEETEVVVWDYENLKLLTVIQLNSPVLFMDVNLFYRILIVSTLDDEFCFFKLTWKNGHLEYKIIYNGDSSFSGLSRNIRGPSKPNAPNESSLKDFQNLPNTRPVSKNQKSLLEDSKKAKKTDPFITSADIQKPRQNTKKSTVKISGVDLSLNRNTQLKNAPTPSIKIISYEGNLNEVGTTQQTLGTLKTLKKIDAQITTRIEIKVTEQNTFLVVANSKGQVSCYNITGLIRDHFTDYETAIKKPESPHIYRPARQDFEQELSRQKYSLLRLQAIQKIDKVKKSFFKLAWKQNCPNKEPITCLSFIEMKKLYLCASTTDGCCKYFDVMAGALKGSLKLNLPLPIIWDIEIEKDLYIRKNVYETLIILDNILSNHGFEMLSKQYQALNVTKFLQTIRNPTKLQQNIQSKKQNQQEKNETKKVTLLHQEYSIDDIKKISHGVKETLKKENTLKSLEAYKRVKQIKEQMSQQLRGSSEDKNEQGPNIISNQLMRNKEELQKLLASNYFSALGESGAESRLNKSMETGSLEERSILLLEKVKMNKKKLASEHQDRKPLQIGQRKPQYFLPTIQTVRSQVFEQKSTVEGELDNNLMSRVANSLSMISGGGRQKNTQVSSLYFGSLCESKINGSGSLKKKSLLLKSKCSKLPELQGCKQNNGGKTESGGVKLQKIKETNLEDKSTRDILKEINGKLQKYKKANFKNRQIF